MSKLSQVAGGKAPAAEFVSPMLPQAPEELAGFVRTLFTLLRVCDPEIISWSHDGKSIVVRDPQRFAAQVCPKFFRHRNFNSFTRLLNMYQFHKVPSTGRDKSVTFSHVHFQRDREGELHKIHRKGAVERAASKPAATLAAEAGREAKRSKGRGVAAAAASSSFLSATASATATDPKTSPSEVLDSKPDVSKPRRSPAIFPSAAHYRAAAGSPEALMGRDLWERTNKEITELEKRSGYLTQSTVGDASAVSTWMCRVVDLEKETKRLRSENDRLRVVESELDLLRKQVEAQAQVITQFQDGSFAGVAAPGDAVASMSAALIGDVDDGGPPPHLPPTGESLYHHFCEPLPTGVISFDAASISFDDVGAR